MTEPMRICVADFCPSGDWLALMGMTILVTGLFINYMPRLVPKWRRKQSRNFQTVVICCDFLGLLLTAAGVALLGFDKILLVLALAALMLAMLGLGLFVLARVWKKAKVPVRGPDTARSPLEMAAITARFVLAVGAIVLILALAAVWGTGWGVNLFAPAATLIAAGLASYVALKSVVTWNEQRRRERDQTELKHREEIYEEIVTHMTFAFLPAVTGSRTREEQIEALATDATHRSKAAVWADTSTLSALARWQEMKTKISAEQNGRPGELKEKLMTCFYDVVVAMRQDLSGSNLVVQPNREDLLRSIFNDRPTNQPAGGPPTAGNGVHAIVLSDATRDE